MLCDLNWLIHGSRKTTEPLYWLFCCLLGNKVTGSTFANDFYLPLKRQQVKGQVTLTSRNPQKSPQKGSWSEKWCLCRDWSVNPALVFVSRTEHVPGTDFKIMTGTECWESASCLAFSWGHWRQYDKHDSSMTSITQHRTNRVSLAVHSKLSGSHRKA